MLKTDNSLNFELFIIEFIRFNVNVFSSFFLQLIQIVANFRNGHTGQLSAITVFLLLGGSLARIFTTIQETGDALLLSQYLVACSLNAIMWSQILYYWNVTPSDKLKKA